MGAMGQPVDSVTPLRSARIDDAVIYRARFRFG